MVSFFSIGKILETVNMTVCRHLIKGYTKLYRHDMKVREVIEELLKIDIIYSYIIVMENGSDINLLEQMLKD